MSYWKSVCLVAVVCCVLTSVGTAQQRPIKQRPANVQSYADNTKEFKEGDMVAVTRTVKEVVVVNGVEKTVQKSVQAVVAVPKRTWMIGAQGWHDFEGFNIDNLVKFRIGSRLVDSPLSKVQTTINGRTIEVALEAADVITSIEGYNVDTELNLFIAIHTAPNPRMLNIEFINHRDGKTMTGMISAIKVRP